MLLHITTMSSPAVDSGTSRPSDAVEAIRKRLRPTGAAMLLDGRMDGETRPWGPIVSICPDTKNAPPEGGAERLRNTPCPEKLPRTENRLVRSPRRQTKLSSTVPPSTVEGLTATDRQAQFLLLTEKHTFANAPGFRDEVPASPLLAQLPMDFGRIVLSVKPYSPGLPLSPSIRTVPPVAVRREVPRLDCSYCAMQRQCLHTSLAFRLPLGFPRPMFHSG